MIRKHPCCAAFCIAAVLRFAAPAPGLSQEPPRRIGPDDRTGAAAAVIVGDESLVHTSQILPAAGAGGDAAAQMTSVLDRLDFALNQAQSALDRVVKLNLYLAGNEHFDETQRALAARFAGADKPAVSWVTTSLPGGRTLVAADAVATTAAESVDHVASNGKHSLRVCPGGTRIYVAGQAERANSLAEATRKTLESLRATLAFLGRSDADIVQLKAFLMPIREAAVVQREVNALFGESAPPLVLVEWKSTSAVPIEIELIAWGGKNRRGDAVEYLTPPGMTESPVFSRVARVNHTSTIYVSGLYGSLSAGDANRPAAGEREVREVFASLDRILKQAGSDFRHLAKATYYVAHDDVSAKLNELRPHYYDPRRPPAASKAAVAGTGRAGLDLTIDMIAVPTQAESRGN
jgi:enamine deaminase RidA (YjgF/YER057c/UK114 family)